MGLHIPKLSTYNVCSFSFPAETICHAKPGGQDANVAPLNTTIANGTWLDSTYLLTTNDAAPAHLLVRSSGWQAGSLWRAYIKIETGDERYFFLNTRMWIGALTAWNGTTGASYSKPTSLLCCTLTRDTNFSQSSMMPTTFFERFGL